MKRLVIAAAIAAACTSPALAEGTPRNEKPSPPLWVFDLDKPAAAPLSAYRFEIVRSATPPNANSAIARTHPVARVSIVPVRLVQGAADTPVPDAAIRVTRADMSPGGMADMTAPASIRPDGAGGIYDVEIYPTMTGLWALSLAATLPGQADAVRQTLVVPLAN